MMVIPLTDASRRPTRFPVVTAAIIAINALVFLIELSGGDAFVSRWSVIPADIVAGRHWITILTAMFMHGSWSHIIGNMVFLWAFGPEVEDEMGPGPYALFYLLGGLVAALAQVVTSPDSTVPNLGASGAIAAVMGAFLVTYPRDQIRSLLVIFVFLRVAYIPAALLIGVWGLMQFLSLGAVVQQQPSAGGVAYAAHVGGFIFGAVTARLFAHQPLTDLSPLGPRSRTRPP
jgi:membrane associated rhomboid family serine protease